MSLISRECEEVVGSQLGLDGEMIHRELRPAREDPPATEDLGTQRSMIDEAEDSTSVTIADTSVTNADTSVTSELCPSAFLIPIVEATESLPAFPARKETRSGIASILN